MNQAENRFYREKKSECIHEHVAKGPSVPRVYGSWASEICCECGAWRTMTHGSPAQHFAPWRPAAELSLALIRDEDQ